MQFWTTLEVGSRAGVCRRPERTGSGARKGGSGRMAGAVFASMRQTARTLAMTLLLFIVAALVYGAASFSYGAESSEQAEGTSAVQRWARPLLAVAAALHFIAIGAQCVEGDHPFKNIFLATSFGSLIAVAGYLGLSRGRRLEALGPIMAPVGLVGLVLGVVFSGLGGADVPAATTMPSAHVGLASLGLAGFTLAAGVAGLYLTMERRLRRKRFRPGGGGMSLTGLDRLHHRLVLLVTPIFTMAIVTGVLWILDLGGPHMLAGRWFELAAGGLAWIASVSLLVMRAVWGTRGRSSAWLTIVAFFAIVLIVVSYGVRL
jgi:ABC-type uncharacterized transport system permease subunit